MTLVIETQLKQSIKIAPITQISQYVDTSFLNIFVLGKNKIDNIQKKERRNLWEKNTQNL